MDAKNKIAYSVYLPPDLHAKLKALAKTRRSSEMVRNAITMILEGNDAYKSGYNQALRDAIDALNTFEDLNSVSIWGNSLGKSSISKLEALKK